MSLSEVKINFNFEKSRKKKREKLYSSRPVFGWIGVALMMVVMIITNRA